VEVQHRESERFDAGHGYGSEPSSKFSIISMNDPLSLKERSSLQCQHVARIALQDVLYEQVKSEVPAAVYFMIFIRYWKYGRPEVHVLRSGETVKRNGRMQPHDSGT
jgi:hypothetical protein